MTTLTTSFTTPPSNIFLLRRDVEGKDKIFLTDLSGEKAVAVFEHDKINDFRATSTQLVVSVEEDDGSRLLVMDRDGKNQRELKLPGDGYVGRSRSPSAAASSATATRTRSSAIPKGARASSSRSR